MADFLTDTLVISAYAEAQKRQPSAAQASPPDPDDEEERRACFAIGAMIAAFAVMGVMMLTRWIMCGGGVCAAS